MTHTKSFRYGGLSLPQDDSWQPGSPIPNAFLPVTAIIPLRQHEGPAARCVVRKGDIVREGALIGKADRTGSAHIHAPVPGVVRDIRRLRMATGGPVEAVEIAFQGSFDRIGKRAERYVWPSMTRVDMLQCLRDKGVVEMHEPGLPVAELVGSHEHCPLLVLNAIESEPYLRTEATVLKERGKEVLEGLAMLKKILSPEFVMAAFESRDEDEKATLLALLQAADPSIESAFLAPRYPQDLPKQLLSVLRIGKRSFSLKDALIVTPSTALAIHEAVVHAKPLVERYVTIAGAAIKYPAVLKARIGTSIGDLIEECGGLLGRPEKILSGGPLRGAPIFSLDAPVTKQTSGILALTKDETNRKRTEACIRCGRCADVCPERLPPSELFRRLEKGRRGEALAMGLEDCSLCGACGYVCPSRIPLVEAFRCGMKATGASR